MKKFKKTNIVKKKTAVKKRKLVKNILADHSLWRHFRLIEHKHTAKLIHLRHTSHLSLMIVLFVLGILLFSSGSMTVNAVSHNGTVSISALVTGPPPSVGAVITSPIDGYEVTDVSSIDVSGTCPVGTFIVIKNNDILSGSTVCDNNGSFFLRIEIGLGDNNISALDYDNYNQVGPVTPTVKVVAKVSTTKPGVIPITHIDSSNRPTLPDNPSIISGKDGDCSNYSVGNIPADDLPHIVVVCVPRLFLPGIEQKLGIMVWGGNLPYVVNIDWNDGLGERRYSFASEGYHIITFRYASAGVYKINFNLSDNQNKEAFVQTVVQVNGSYVGSTLTISNGTAENLWFETPVPLYVLAVALTLGFWGGDTFDRKFGKGKNYQWNRKKTA